MQRMLEEVEVVADYREKKVLEYLKDLKVKTRSLPVADFIISGRCAIERKSVRDFAESVKSGRIFKQAEELKQFERPVIVVEGGNFYDVPLHPNAVMGAIASLILDFGIAVINTSDAGETAALIKALAVREKKERREVALRGRKKPKGLKQLQEYFLEGLPHIGPKLAKRVLNHFKSVRNFINASESQMKRIEGLGEKKVRDIRRVIDSEYR
ncbi:MAG TPA: hypothetical protein ENF51_01170 [Candidatus Aenigmarchaeota archaeon]|nr:hypothetical protein [Candidatus Aenigmarchaeota archaeon]